MISRDHVDRAVMQALPETNLMPLFPHRRVDANDRAMIDIGALVEHEIVRAGLAGNIDPAGPWLRVVDEAHLRKKYARCGCGHPSTRQGLQRARRLQWRRRQVATPNARGDRFVQRTATSSPCEQ